MPANAVKPGQEHLWTRAKKRAKQQGHTEDWPYIMSIFQTMTKSIERNSSSQLTKALDISPFTRGSRIPGQVPGRNEAYQLMTAKPPELNHKMMMLDDTPKLTVWDVVRNLGLSQEDEHDWEAALERELRPGQPPHQLRAAFLARAREKDLSPDIRLALFRRIQCYTKDVLEPQEAERVEVVQFPERKGGGGNGGDQSVVHELPAPCPFGAERS